MQAVRVDGAVHPGPGATPVPRRRVLGMAAAAVALPPVLAACTGGREPRPDASDALLAMADQAREDAAVVAAAVTGDPALAERLEPLRAARMEHASALDAAGGRAPGEALVPLSPGRADLATVRDAVAAAARTAGEVVGRASAMQVGLVAEVAACCSAYVGVLQ